MDFCLDYGFMILDTVAKLEDQNFKIPMEKINNEVDA